MADNGEMERKSFLKVLATEFYPLLRDEGFRGSGTTLRRMNEPVIHVLNVQGSSSADGFYVNLGAHLSFLSAGGSTFSSGKLKEYECAFRDRIEPPEDARLGRWLYGRDLADAKGIVSRLVEAWRTQGRDFFERFERYPDSFADLVREAIAHPPHSHFGLIYARIASHIGLAAEAVTIARQSLVDVPPGAIALRGSIRNFLGEMGAA